MRVVKQVKQVKASRLRAAAGGIITGGATQMKCRDPPTKNTPPRAEATGGGGARQKESTADPLLSRLVPFVGDG